MCSDLLSRAPLLGLAGASSSRAAITLPLGLHPGQGVRRARVADRHRDRGRLGASSPSTSSATVARRRERHLYVALWFYIATIVTVAVLHIFNNLVGPGGPVQELLDLRRRAGRVHAVVVRPQRRRVLPDDAVPRPHVLLPAQGGGAAGLLATGCRSSTSGRWSSSTSGPARTTCTTRRCPRGPRRSACSSRVMLWMPSWGGMINGLLTLRGAWNKVAEDPVLKFFVVGITFYGMSTFEGPMLSIKSVNALSHYTDWTIAHVHARRARLGRLHDVRHDLLARCRACSRPSCGAEEARRRCTSGSRTVGILLYVVAIYAAGLTQGLMWRAFDETGRLRTRTSSRPSTRLIPMYWVRALGGALYIAGVVLLGASTCFMTWQARPATYDGADAPVPPMVARRARAGPSPPRRAPAARRASTLAGALAPPLGGAAADRSRCWVVGRGASSPRSFEIIPTFLIRSQRPDDRRRCKPYTPLELAGRDIYIARGLLQLPLADDPAHPRRDRCATASTASPASSSTTTRSSGARGASGRTCTASAASTRTCGTCATCEDPRSTTPQSIMPAYPWLARDPVDWRAVGAGRRRPGDARRAVSRGTPPRTPPPSPGRRGSRSPARSCSRAGPPASRRPRWWR